MSKVKEVLEQITNPHKHSIPLKTNEYCYKCQQMSCKNSDFQLGYRFALDEMKENIPELELLIRQAIADEIREKVGEKEKIDITKKMCHNLEYPTPCLYDEPNSNGATCLSQDRGIPKEKCNDYKDMQVEYETFEEWNSCLAQVLKAVKGE